MSSKPGAAFQTNPEDQGVTNLEARLGAAAAALSYPATPDLAARERIRLAKQRRTTSRQPRRLAFGVVILMIVVLVGLLVSPARARVLDWIRIGAVRIFFVTPQPPAPQLPSINPEQTGTPPTTATPEITPTLLKSVLDLDGETTLESARERAGFAIQMPVYPDDLGLPDFVYLQQFRTPVVILVWMDPQSPGEVRLSLSETSSQQPVFEKYDPRSVMDTSVGGNPAVWVEGDYVVLMRNGDTVMARMIRQGHTLIWSDGAMTFRLETDTDLETAIQIAESLR